MQGSSVAYVHTKNPRNLLAHDYAERGTINRSSAEQRRTPDGVLRGAVISNALCANLSLVARNPPLKRLHPAMIHHSTG